MMRDGGSRRDCPFGYQQAEGRLVPDPERAGYVQELFARYPTENLHAICKDFQARDVRVKPFTSRAGVTSGGTLVCYGFLAAIIDRSIYAGRFHHRGEWIDAKVDALITFEQWEVAQRVKENRRPAPRDPAQFLLLNLLYDDHGRQMKGKGFRMGHAKGEKYYRSNMLAGPESKGPDAMVERPHRRFQSALISLRPTVPICVRRPVRCGNTRQLSRALGRACCGNRIADEAARVAHMFIALSRGSTSPNH